jgi:hypothetical protein
MTKHRKQEHSAEEVAAIISYTPVRPGYVWDHGWQKIPGHEEVTLHHIAALAEDLWGGRILRGGYDVPCRQDRTHKPKGKWRKRKNRELGGSAPYWCIRLTTETGRKYATGEFYDERK